MLTMMNKLYHLSGKDKKDKRNVDKKTPKKNIVKQEAESDNISKSDPVLTSKVQEIVKARRVWERHTNEKVATDPTEARKQAERIKNDLLEVSRLYAEINTLFLSTIETVEKERTTDARQVVEWRGENAERLLRLEEIESESKKQNVIGAEIADRWDAFVMEILDQGKDRRYLLEEDDNNTARLDDQEVAFMKAKSEEFAKFHQEAFDDRANAEKLAKEKIDLNIRYNEVRAAVVVLEEKSKKIQKRYKNIAANYTRFKKSNKAFSSSPTEEMDELSIGEDTTTTTTTTEEADESNEMDIVSFVSKEDDQNEEDVLPDGRAFLIIPELPVVQQVILEVEEEIEEGDENVKKATLYFSAYKDIEKGEKHSSSSICQYKARRVDTDEEVSIQIIPYVEEKSETQVDLYELLSQVESFTKLHQYYYVRKFPASVFPPCADINKATRNLPFHVYISDPLPSLHLANVDYTRFVKNDKLCLLFEVLDALQSAKKKYGIEHNALEELASVRLIENAQPRSYKLSTGEDVECASSFKVLLTDFNSATAVAEKTKSLIDKRTLLCGKDYSAFYAIFMKREMFISDAFLGLVRNVLSPNCTAFDLLKSLIHDELHPPQSIIQ